MSLRRRVTLALLILVPGCAEGMDNNQVEALETNTIVDAAAAQRSAGDRADNLDERAEALKAEAARVGGAAGRSLANEADEDYREAAAVRSDGERRARRIDDIGADAVDRIENATAPRPGAKPQ